MSPAECIAALDAGLADNGESVRLMRIVGGVPIAQASCLAIMRGYKATDVIPQSNITQQDQLAIFSPTMLLAANWPTVGASPVPRSGDRIISNRGPLAVMAAVGFYVQDILVRIEAQVRGA